MTTTLRILAVDCTGDACSVALADSSGVIGTTHVPMRRGHAERVVPQIAETLAAAGLGANDLTALAVTVGPGAFTGVRVGLAAVQGFSIAANLPVFGITVFELYHHDWAGSGAALVALETRRDDFYIQLFDAAGRPDGQPGASDGESVTALLQRRNEPVTLIGNAANRLAGLAPLDDLDIADVVDRPGLQDSAAIAASIAVGRAGTGTLPDPADLPAPLYLRPPEAKTLAEQS